MTRRDVLALAPALLLFGCSSTPEPRVEKKPAEPVTGLHALYAMYGKARLWAPDIKILRLSSINIDKVKSQPGKAPAWQVIFASESLQHYTAGRNLPRLPRCLVKRPPSVPDRRRPRRYR
jgi:hypothetical protein